MPQKKALHLRLTSLYGVVLIIAGVTVIIINHSMNEYRLFYNLPVPLKYIYVTVIFIVLLTFLRIDLRHNINEDFRFFIDSIIGLGSFLLIAMLFSQLLGCSAEGPSGPIFRFSVLGPKTIHSNEQVAVTAKLELEEHPEIPKNNDNGSDTVANTTFGIESPTKSGEYNTTARIQPGSFGISPDLAGWREKQRVAKNKPAEWNWIIVPQLERLGIQTIGFEAMILDERSILLKDTSLITTIQVVGPTGMPSWLGYFATGLGSLLGVPLWFWLYQEISLRLKEKREAQRKKRESDEVKISPTQNTQECGSKKSKKRRKFRKQ
jgi:hypothetical protein